MFKQSVHGHPGYYTFLFMSVSNSFLTKIFKRNVNMIYKLHSLYKGYKYTHTDIFLRKRKNDIPHQLNLTSRCVHNPWAPGAFKFSSSYEVRKKEYT